MPSDRIAIIGGGLNGLIAAAYLARAGRKVIVLEARGELGGPLRTDAIVPDYRISTGAHLIWGLPKRIISDLKLKRHGLETIPARLETLALDTAGYHLTLGKNLEGPAGLATRSDHDLRAYGPAMAALDELAALARRFIEAPGLTATDPSLLQRLPIFRSRRDAWSASELETIWRAAVTSASQWLEEQFEDDLLQGALAFDATLGHFAGPKSPGSLLTLVYRRALTQIGGGMWYPIGGVGALIGSLRKLLEELGVEIRTNAPVRSICVADDTVAGVELGDGEIVDAGIVVSSLDPKGTLIDLLDPRHIEPEQMASLHGWRMRGAAAKINLALNGRPTFKGFSDRESACRLIIAPSADAVEAAFTSMKKGTLASRPVMEIVMPSALDATLAPEGHEVMSVLVSHAPYELTGGWEAGSDQLMRAVIATISEYAIDLDSRIIAGEVLTPPDIEAQFGAPGGHWYQGDMVPDQLGAFRGCAGLPDYETPVQGLYLCGVGTHPGGGINGLSGRAAAHSILRKEDAS